ncbi:MAG: hypothetical protein LUE99_11285 [Bacteroides sp.]|nr:hypothetical protein [Bacteroides sp.]
MQSPAGGGVPTGKPSKRKTSGTTEEGHHIYYDRKLVAALEKERLKAKSVAEEEK